MLHSQISFQLLRPCVVCAIIWYDMFVVWRNKQLLYYLLNGAHGDRRYDPSHNYRNVGFYSIGMV